MVDIINSPADWRGPDMLKRTAWIHELSASEKDEILTALAAAKKNGVSFETMTAENFPLPQFSKALAHARDMLEEGPGIFQFRGAPIEALSKADARLIYWGFGRHLGTAVSQSHFGDILGDVRDFGSDINSADGRGYRSRQQLSYHTDTCDVVGLMVLRTAKEGGLSILASSLAVHNEMVRTRPDLAAALYEPLPWSWNKQEPAGEAPWYLQPLFSVHKGKFCCRYVRKQIENSQRFADAPRLTPQQTEAMALFDKLASSDEFRIVYEFHPGDMQLLNNHVAVHSRTEFTDFEDEDRKRHLLRMWLSVPNSRELSDAMHVIYRDRRAGAVRGGFPSRSGHHVYDTMQAVTTD
ncbi:MAG: TauD/TfdA family dioxygenase [Beijerinckiaceae bacterium]